MKLYTYYSPVREIDAEHEIRLITLWRRHNAVAGFEPVVLTEYQARQHPYFEKFAEAVRRLPSANPEGYDAACFYRWLAMAQFGGIMCDYDLFAFRTRERDPTAIANAIGPKLRVWENIVPSLVTGTTEAYLRQCELFAAYSPTKDDLFNGKAHISDMLILQYQAMHGQADSFDRVQVVRSWGDANWAEAPFVHFCNAAMGPKGLKPRWKYLGDLIKQHHGCQS